jgi:hypothetical protein
MSLVNTLPRFLSCAPLRNMMFLNCEWPAIPNGSRQFPLVHTIMVGRRDSPVTLTGRVASQYGSIAAQRRSTP